MQLESVFFVDIIHVQQFTLIMYIIYLFFTRNDKNMFTNFCVFLVINIGHELLYEIVYFLDKAVLV